MLNLALKALGLLSSAALILTGCGSIQAEPIAAPGPALSATQPGSPPVVPPEDDSLIPAPPHIPEGYTGPRIKEPEPVAACPYHEEVGAVQGVKAQVDLALELGCEADIFGEVIFTEPLPGGVSSLISVEHAMSVQEMCDEGVMNKDDCAIELSY